MLRFVDGARQPREHIVTRVVEQRIEADDFPRLDTVGERDQVAQRAVADHDTIAIHDDGLTWRSPGSRERQGDFRRAERVGADSMLHQIVALVAQAQRSKAPVQRLADRVAGVFVAAVLAVAAATFALWALFGPEPSLAYALVNSVAVLIIACPCALGLATPMSIVVAMGKGAGGGVLFRNAEAIEKMMKKPQKPPT